MAKPEQDLEANARKRRVDEMAGSLLGVDKKAVRRTAEEISRYLRKPIKMVITGPTGASKSTIGRALSILLEVPSFDLDEYIPGGWTPDTEGYANAFSEGMGNLWEDLPWANSWIIEHVQASGTAMRDMFRPTYSLFLNPGSDHLKDVVKARQAYGVYEKGILDRRLDETSYQSLQQFRSTPGEVMAKGRGWELKKVEN